MASTELSPSGNRSGPARSEPAGAGGNRRDDDHIDAEARASAAFSAELRVLAARREAQDRRKAEEAQVRRRFWLAHHWPEHYNERCFLVGGRPVCRRCSALYPLGFAVAFAAALGRPLWPTAWDPLVIWLLCLPATVAFVGEMLGWFRYSIRWQVGTTLVAGLAFGKALGYELTDRWSPEFWGPIAVFGGIWFFASYAGHHRRARRWSPPAESEPADPIDRSPERQPQ